MMLKLLSRVVCLIVAALVASTVFAQGVQTGTVRGTVRGTNGAPVSNATVTVSSSALLGPRSAVTGANGTYVLTLLPPGEYAVEIRSTTGAKVEQHAVVPLGGVVEVDVRLQSSNLDIVVDVVAPLLTTPTVSANYEHDAIDALATSRTLAGIARFAPGVNDLVQTAGPTEGQGQVIINGGFGYDNVFMLNGVDVNDNIFGWPQNLFIEDAIAETQILTSGITAEYGRFGGGVVNAITKSGGNLFSGTYRLNLANDSWSTETPFERSSGRRRVSRLNTVHEGTFGGPIVKDRLWFFLAGRYARQETSPTLPVTGAQYLTTDRNERGEIKISASVAPGHTVQGSAIGNPRRQTNQANFTGGLATIDPFALSDKERPNHLLAFTYRGVARQQLLLDAQYSHEQFETNAGGGTDRSLVESPFVTLDFSEQYNAPYFDASDPDRRNNRQLTGSAQYFTGAHQLKIGYEWFRSQKIGGNTPSPSGYVFQTDYLKDANGRPALDSDGRIVPLFTPGDTFVLHFISTPGATLNIDHNSVYAQDHWIVSKNVSADVGVRLEHATTSATDVDGGVDAVRTVPRLGVGYDVRGDGRYVLHATYGHYSGRYSDALFIANSHVGNPDEIDGIYDGPEGQGRTFAAGFDLANYDFDNVFASFPTANVRFDPDLRSPLTKEFTTSFGVDLRQKGTIEAAYVWRRTGDLVEDFTSLANGTTSVVEPGVDLTLTNRVYANTDFGSRRYQGLEFQGGYTVRPGWTWNGHWTVQLENEGNYEGEAPNRIITSAIGDYPEIFTESWHYPTGRLTSFQRHKVHLWSVYALDFGRAGSGSVSGLWRYNSARIYSLRATTGITAAQHTILDDFGYPDSPLNQAIFYSSPGSEEFAGYGVFDTSASYNVPVFGRLRPMIKVDLFNVFNNQKLISWNTSISPDPTTPADELGLRTGYRTGPLFGTATSNTNFPLPFPGQTGGRTLRIAFGVRF
ncbi:MAG TPA: carboxypeptidase regulatory-like domain-containing protein [Vicinamibacterales bacterium]|nr:carboxypeptidase regulatory-like domain-containing protein [Vicinamibacterales bacterium]